MKTLKDFLMENEKELVVSNKYRKGENNQIAVNFNMSTHNRRSYQTNDIFRYGDERIISVSTLLDDHNDINILHDNLIIREIADFDKNMPKEIFAYKKDYEYAYNVIETEFGYIIIRKGLRNKFSIESTSISVYYKEDFGDTKIFTPEYDEVKPRYELSYRKHNDTEKYNFRVNIGDYYYLNARCRFTNSNQGCTFVTTKNLNTKRNYYVDELSNTFDRDLFNIDTCNSYDIKRIKYLEDKILNAIRPLKASNKQIIYKDCFEDDLCNSYTIVINPDTDNIISVTMDEANGDKSTYSNFKNLKFKDIKDNFELYI